jgi:hypothetical protein
MKKTRLTKIKVEKAKRIRKRTRRGGSLGVKDPKDLRGAKGALLRNATAVALEDESSNRQAAEKPPPTRIQKRLLVIACT